MYVVTLYDLTGKPSSDETFDTAHEMNGWIRCTRRTDDGHLETYIFPAHRIHCVRVNGRPHHAADDL